MRPPGAAVLALCLLLLGTPCRVQGTVDVGVEERSRGGQDFWETGVGSGLEGPAYTSLREMAESSRVAVLGRAVAVRSLEAPGFVAVRLDVLEEFRSVAPGSEEYTIRVPSGDAPGIGVLQQRLPSGRGLYLLGRRADGTFEFLSPQALLIEIDGRVAAPLIEEESPGFPSEVVGSPFTDLAETLRRMTS